MCACVSYGCPHLTPASSYAHLREHLSVCMCVVWLSTPDLCAVLQLMYWVFFALFRNIEASCDG